MKKTRFLLVFALAITGFFSVVYFGFAQDSKEKIKNIRIFAVSPADKLYSAMQKGLYRDYAEGEEDRNFKIKVESFDEDEIITKFTDNKCDVIALTRPFKKDEILAYTTKNFRAPRIIPVFKIAVVVLVNKSNINKEMTLENLKKIFSGEIKSWKELNKESVDDVIDLILPESKSPVYKLFKKKILKGADFGTENVSEFKESKLPEQLKLKPGGITFVSRCYFIKKSLPFNEMTLLNSEGEKYLIEEEDIRKERYPLVMTIYLYVSEVEPEALKKLMKFAKKKAKGVGIYRNLNFVNVKAN